MTTNTHEVPIIATGGFNTGRLYSLEGQRVFWALRSDHWLYFHDIDRCISGWIETDYHVEPDDITPRYVQGKYDRNEYRMGLPASVPGNYSPNPEVPDDFYFGRSLRI